MAPIVVTAGTAGNGGVAAELIGWMTTTMTLALPKTGLDGEAVGRLRLADIRIPREVYRWVGVHPPEGLFTPGYRVQLAKDGQDVTRS